MKIEHIRYGRETNSSSSHCFTKAPSRMDIPRGETVRGGEFGWEWKVIEDPKELMGYLLMQAMHVVGSDNVREIMDEFDVEMLIDGDSYIDHASRFRIEGSDYAVGSFMKDLIKYVYDNGLTVVTGNDNYDAPPDMQRMKSDKWIGNAVFNGCHVTMPQSNTYVIIGNSYGRWKKLRIRVGEEETLYEYPESIDVKITSRCYNDCPFCYEDANKDGKHCDYEDFRRMICGISGYTAEVALGGGNPLLHPHLFNMLEYAKANYVLPAITVRDTDMVKFLEDVGLTSRVKDVFRNVAVGLSFSDIDIIERVFELSGYSFMYTVHFINRVHSMNDVLEYAKRNQWKDILVLGYKDCGRGATYKPEHNDMDADVLLDLPEFHGNVMFDNLAVEQLGVRRYVTDPEWNIFFGGQDGEYTMFIDLVNMKFAKSSYAKETYPYKGYVVEAFAKLKEAIR